MLFSGKNQKKLVVPSSKQVVVVVGGGGVLGKKLFETLPADFFLINVSRKRGLSGNNVANYHCDLLESSPEDVIEGLSRVTERVDVLVNAAYDLGFTSVQNMRREKFLREIELDVYVPLSLSVACASHFWAPLGREHNSEQGRKVINISSGSAFGKTKRPELATYSGAKAALNVMTEYLHEHLYGTVGVGAHIIAPGSFNDSRILEETAASVWDLASQKLSEFSLKKVL